MLLQESLRPEGCFGSIPELWQQWSMALGAFQFLLQ
jgi:hypothetical protein